LVLKSVFFGIYMTFNISRKYDEDSWYRLSLWWILPIGLMVGVVVSFAFSLIVFLILSVVFDLSEFTGLDSSLASYLFQLILSLVMIPFFTYFFIHWSISERNKQFSGDMEKFKEARSEIMKHLKSHNIDITEKEITETIKQVQIKQYDLYLTLRFSEEPETNITIVLTPIKNKYRGQIEELKDIIELVMKSLDCPER